MAPVDLRAAAGLPMIELRTLGGLQLTGRDGRELRSVLAQPKRLVLLAYLAAHNHHTSRRRRDSLVALFWPELDTDHARGALRQSLRFLRRALGDGVLSGHSEEEVGFEAAALWCDAVAFEQACGAGRLEEALALYRGDFFEGFFVSGAAPELERWVEAERARLRRLAARAAAELAVAAEREGDSARAIEAARRALALEPDDEAALTRLVGLLDRCGDRAGALSAYAKFRQHLQQVYDVTPAPETNARIQSIRERQTPFAHVETVNHPGLRPAAVRSSIRTRRLLKVAGLVGLVAVATLAVMWWRASAPTPTNSGLVAVLPFRVGGADSSLRHLREGMAELMALELTGEGGPRGLPPGALLNAWRGRAPTSSEELAPDAAVALAHRVGAGRFLDGGVVGTREHLTITATLHSATGGGRGASASVTGSYDSLQVLVDRLTAQLLAGEAGTAEPRLAGLTSLPALRAYLEGRTAFRRGRMVDALRHFTRALQADSTFAPAAVGLRSASLWINGIDAPRGERLAWTFRQRLSAPDRAFLVTELGPRYPAPYTVTERISAWEELLERYPDMAEGWYRLGDLYYHSGAAVGLEAPLERARSALQRALALDSALGSEALGHLIEIAALWGDTAALRPLLAAGLAMDSSADRLEAYRWFTAFTARDSAALAALRLRVSELRTSTLLKMWSMSQQAGFDVAEAVRAQGELAARVDSGINPGDVLTAVYELALNRGRPHEAQSVAEAMSPGWSPADRLAVVVLSGLYGDGDTAAAAAAARVLEKQATAPFAHAAKQRHDQYEYVCVVEQWHVAHGAFASLPVAIAKLRVPDATAPAWLSTQNAMCSATLEAALAASRARPDAGVLAERLDSMIHAGPEWRWSFPRHRVLARLWESRGDRHRALDAVRRRRRPQVRYLASDLHEEGRLAALVGDTAGAIRAYRHYLALRLDPEPGVRPEVEGVLAELTRLDAGAAGSPAVRSHVAIAH